MRDVTQVIIMQTVVVQSIWTLPPTQSFSPLETTAWEANLNKDSESIPTKGPPSFRLPTDYTELKYLINEPSLNKEADYKVENIFPCF